MLGEDAVAGLGLLYSDGLDLARRRPATPTGIGYPGCSPGDFLGPDWRSSVRSGGGVGRQTARQVLWWAMSVREAARGCKP